MFCFGYLLILNNFFSFESLIRWLFNVFILFHFLRHFNWGAGLEQLSALWSLDWRFFLIFFRHFNLLLCLFFVLQRFLFLLFCFFLLNLFVVSFSLFNKFIDVLSCCFREGSCMCFVIGQSSLHLLQSFSVEWRLI